MSLTPAEAFALELVLILLCAFFAAHRPARPFALAAATAGVAVPFFVATDQPSLVFCLALLASLVALRAVDLVRAPAEFEGLQRAWHLVAWFDTRRVTRRPRELLLRLAALDLVWLAIGCAGFAAAILVAPRHDGAVRALWRYGGFAVAAVAGSSTRSIEVAYAVIGLRPPVQHDRVWASRSVREFWGERWNLYIGLWLRENVFQPLRRAGRPAVGLALAFVASAVIHVYLVLPSLGAYWAGIMGLFFVAQIGLIQLERVLRVERWPRAAAHLWTLSALLVTSPLFSEPACRTLDPLAAPIRAMLAAW